MVGWRVEGRCAGENLGQNPAEEATGPSWRGEAENGQNLSVTTCVGPGKRLKKNPLKPCGPLGISEFSRRESPYSGTRGFRPSGNPRDNKCCS